MNKGGTWQWIVLALLVVVFAWSARFLFEDDDPPPPAGSGVQVWRSQKAPIHGDSGDPWVERSQNFRDIFAGIATMTAAEAEKALSGLGDEVGGIALSDGETLLTRAAAANPDPGVVRLLLAAGADPDYCKIDGCNVLITALRNPNPAIMPMLLKAGADPNRLPAGGTELVRVLDIVAHDLYGNDEQRLQWARALLAAGALVDPPTTEKDGMTPLYAAAGVPGNARMIALLLEAGADVDRPGPDGETPLMRAVRLPDNVEAIRLLLAANPTLDAHDRNGKNALRHAVDADSGSEALLLLAAAGAGVDDRDRDMILAAIERGATLAAVSALETAGAPAAPPLAALESAARRNSDPKIAEWALDRLSPPPDAAALNRHLAIALGNNANPEVARVFIDRGADLLRGVREEDGGETSLLAHALRNATAAKSMCGLLFANGLGWEDLRDPRHPNPLCLAIHCRNFHPLAQFMLDTGVDIDGQNALGLGPLHYAASAGTYHVPEGENMLREYTPASIVARLLELGADARLRDRHGCSALVYALVFGELSCLGDLIPLFAEHGVDLADRDGKGATPLMNVLMFRRDRRQANAIAQYLLERGADIEARDHGGATPLMYAVSSPFPRRENAAIVETLLNAGAAIAARDRNGMTPLTLAMRGGLNPEIVEKLLAAGADASARDARGRSVLMHLAMRGRHIGEIEKTIGLLRDAGADMATRDADGFTALDHAIASGRPESILAFAMATRAVPDPSRRFSETTTDE